MRSPALARERIEQHLPEILESMTDAVMVLDREGTIIYVNEAVEQLSGRSRAELLGQRSWEAFAEAFTPELFREYARVVEERVPMALEAYYPPRDLWLEVHVSSWSEGLALLLTDVSARKRAEEERTEALQRAEQARVETEHARQRIETILESITDAFFALDAQGRFTYVNRRAAEIWGMARDTLIGHSLWEVFPQFAGTEMQSAYDELVASKQSFATELYYPPNDTWIRIRAYPTEEGISVYFEDITQRKRTEEDRERLLGELERQKTLLQVIVDNVRAGLAVLRGQNLVVELTNPEHDAILPGKIVLGKTLRETWPEIADKAEPLLRRVLDTGEPYAVEDMRLSVQRRPGEPTEEIYLSYSFVRLPADASGEAAVLVTIHDTTQWVRARQRIEALAAEAQLRAAEIDTIIASVPDGIVVYGRDATVLRANPAAEERIGIKPGQRGAGYEPYTEATVLTTEQGKPFPMEQHPVPRALAGETVRGVVLALERPGQPRLWLSVSAAPIRAPDGSIVGAVAVMADITKQHELLEQREDILRAVSHDLRNPLAGILGQAQLCRRRLAKAGMERERETADTIITTAQRMNTMIQDLVDSARSEWGQLRIERQPVDLRSFTLELKAQLSATMETARIEIEIPADLPQVCADPARLERILTNLWSNALKYSSPGTTVTVSARQEADWVITSISDHGPGIPPEDLARLFERYSRVRAGRREAVGLGLYITRQLVEAHGGRVWAESTVGVGSVFSFSLPLAEECGTQDVKRHA